MHLTRFTDNALRALVYLALAPGATRTVREVAGRMGMSEDHLLKVVQRMTRHGFIETVRGRNGGMRLARPAEEIGVGEVVRATEENMALTTCFCDGTSCPIVPACALARVLADALSAFMATLDRYTIADLVDGRETVLLRLVGVGAGAAP